MSHDTVQTHLFKRTIAFTKIGIALNQEKNHLETSVSGLAAYPYSE